MLREYARSKSNDLQHSLGGRTNVGQGTDYSARVERCTREDCGAQEEQWAKRCGLAGVETLYNLSTLRRKTERSSTHQPERVLHEGVLWGRVHGTHHGTDGPDQAHTEHKPGVRGHDAEGDPILEHRAGSERSDCETCSSVLEALVKVRPLCWRERITSLSIQDSIRGEDCSCNRHLIPMSVRHIGERAGLYLLP